jgi:RNA polymerase sigma-70 factor (ECF subfamily)
MGSPDAQFVARAQEGDQEAFAVLYHRHVRLVYSLARHLLGDDERAMDATQEVFVKVWQALPRLRETEAFTGWLRVITTNIVRDYGRRRKPEAPMADEQREDRPERDVEDPSPSAVDAMIEQEGRGLIREAVARLPEPQRVVIVMHHFEEQPVASIAEELQVPLGTVLSRLARGRETLRRRLAPRLETRG